MSEVALRYAAKGADKAKRKDQQVAQQTQKTARMAKREAPAIRSWMREHRAAIAAIGTATAGAMAAIINATPSLQASLGGIRLAFSLVAMQIGSELTPAFLEAEEGALDLAQGFLKLDEKHDGLPAKMLGLGLAIATVGAAAALAGPKLAVAGAALAPFVILAGIAIGVLGGLEGNLGLVAAGFLTTAAGVAMLAGQLALALPLALGVAAVGSTLLTIWGVMEGKLWAVVAGVGGLIASVAGLLAFFGKLVAVIKVIGAGIAILASALGISFGSAVVLVVGLIVGLIATLWALFTNWDAVTSEVASAGDWLARQAGRFWGWFTGHIPSRAEISNAASGMVSWFSSLPGRARQWGEDMIDEFVSGIQSAGDRVGDAVGGVKDRIVGMIGFDLRRNDRMAERWGRDFIDHFTQGIDSRMSSLDASLGHFGQGALPTPRGGGGGGAITVVLEQGAVQLRGQPRRSDLDERDLAEEIGKAFADRFGGRSS
ncbi:hypothetical protein BRD56_05450 [Thermoplasmatales archaeon SW_10_69_26]|nr:MAG: hypothetical protein BRD56_05450 [Thermoplasmatales archaeon SW_10_69_26]